MAEKINFPANLSPTGRSYKAGRYPEKLFQSLDGSVVSLRYGRQSVDAELTLTFENIPTSEGNSIFDHYHQVMGSTNKWKYVDFSKNRGLQGLNDTDMLLKIEQRDTDSSPPKLHWRYAEPPTMTQSHRGLCTVSCKFRGFLDG